jgi:3-oxoadipate enol-lactonase
MGAHVRAGDLEIWTEQVGEGPDVLLIAGAGDPVEVWQYQLDGLAGRYRMTAFDNRGVGRTRMPEDPVTVEAMAEDAVGVLDALGITSAHVAGYSGGSVIAQELALRHPARVRSLVLQSTWAAMDAYYRSWVRFVQWLADAAPSPRAFLEGFYLDIYTPRAYEDGTVAALIDDALAFPHQQSAEDLQRFLDPLPGHDTTDRLPRIAAPTLVLSGAADPGARPALGRVVAEAIPGALFEVQEGQSHQPFQEIPDAWNTRVDTFWQDVETRLGGLPHPRTASERERVTTSDPPRA